MTDIMEMENGFFADENHRIRALGLESVVGESENRGARYYAVLYLLTATERLYRNTAACFSVDDVDFDEAVLRGFTGQEYAIYKAAREIYLELGDIILSEMCDSYIVGETAFRLIMNAVMLVREESDEQLHMI